MRQGCDISNWTSLDQYTADFLHGYMDFVCIGLQDTVKAQDFRDMIYGDGLNAPDFEWYADLPRRSLKPCSPGQWGWIDEELGCFQTQQDVRNQGTAYTEAGMTTLIYCNETSHRPIWGDSTELADYGCELVYAAYVPPLPKNWTPFGGWQTWREWQCSSLGLRINKGQGSVDINCDLLVAP